MAGGSGGASTGEAYSVTPDSDTIERLHTNSDVDVRKESQHHTLGPLPTQASPGNHSHRGGDSELLLTGETVTGSRTNGTALLSVIQILVKLGATDSSTA